MFNHPTIKRFTAGDLGETRVLVVRHGVVKVMDGEDRRGPLSDAHGARLAFQSHRARRSDGSFAGLWRPGPVGEQPRELAEAVGVGHRVGCLS
jgi:hypothetical protein